ncbi:MAG: hypothetical protein ACE145_15845 [Terriglobia bacterium]
MFLPFTAIALTYVLGGLILVRAWRGKQFSRFSFFFSYLIYFLGTGVIMNLVDLLDRQDYPLAFWLRFLTLVVAEFALLVEIGDHIFAPYPAIRSLGRLVTILITLAFSTVYILPSLYAQRPSSVAVLDLVMRSAITKCAVLVALLAAARLYGVRPSRTVAGLALGLALYLAISTANFALAESWGPAVYGQAFSLIGPMSQVLCLLIWMITFWKTEPLREVAQPVPAGGTGTFEPLPDRLSRMNTILSRLFKK